MSKKPSFLAIALLACMAANAQQKKQVFRFPCQPGQTSLNSSQQKMADSLYQYLAEGESMRLDLLSENEESLKEPERARISYQRASLLMDHYRRAGVSEKEYCTEFVPFAMPNVVRTTDLTRASSISMGRKSQSHLLLTRKTIMATADPAVNFDADISEGLQQFEFYPSEGIYATLGSGTVIHIPANSLQHFNGQNPECAKVTLRVTEYLDLEAMALKAMSTTSSGKKLQTGGMWYIDVVCNGKPLAMKQGQRYSINVSIKGEPKDMRVFTGRVKNGLLDWKEETDDKVILPGQGPVIDSNQVDPEEVYSEVDNERNYSINQDAVFGMSDAYSLQLNDFGWINCDAFDQAQQLTDLMVYGEINEQTNVLLVYGKRKSVLPGYLCEDKKTVKFSNIAADETAMLVVFKKTDDKGSVVKYTRVLQPGKNKGISVVLTASTAENLRSEIKSKLSDL